MPLAGKSQGPQGAIRPGVTQSHRGRLVRNIVILGACLAFGFMFLSNALSPSDEDQASPQEEQMAEFEALNDVNSAPKVEAAPANPFDMLRVAELPSGFEGSTSYKNLVSTAEETAEQLSTYSARQTPEEYVDSVENIDDSLRSELLASSKESWADIKEADISVEGEIEGTDPVVRNYNEESTLATVEVVVRQTVTNPDGTTSSQTRSYTMDLVGTTQDGDDIAWTIGGFQKQ